MLAAARALRRWGHERLVTVSRAEELLQELTLEEKVAQLVSYWLDQMGDDVAPMQGEMSQEDRYGSTSAHGLGHLTRVYGTRPVDPVERAQWLWEEQRNIRARSGHNIGAIVHEECLTGLAAWQATAFPTPLAWGASFDPEAVEEMAEAIGESMRQLGVHQGLAPVLDVIRDPRWGRVDECISEDPYLVGTIGTAYVKGLQQAGIDATLKHFLGYSNSQAGRNHAPVHMGKREIADVFLPPFEMAIKDGNARSVMNSYSEIDGVPVASDPEILTGILRDKWGFDGTVVADYFAVAFLQLMHAVAGSREEAASLALTAGIDVELPSGDAYPTLIEAVKEGRFPEEIIDRSVLRVLKQKERHGLLDEDLSEAPETIDLDSPRNRAIALKLAEESMVLLRNEDALPLRSPQSIAVIGPNAKGYEPLMGCYSFVNHVLAHHPGTPAGIDIPDVHSAVEEAFAGTPVAYAEGCSVEGDSTEGFAEAVAAAEASDVVVAVMGDRAGLFGRGTVGEGNDAESLDLPGVQRELVAALVSTGKPVVLVLLTGRPYDIAWALGGDDAPAAVIQSFFPGEEGASAVARLLSGEVSPSGRLPVSMPRSAGAQPFNYRHPILGGASSVTSVDSAPVLPFGFGLTYTEFSHRITDIPESVTAGETFSVDVAVKNVGAKPGTDVVQLYLRDKVGSVTRPVAQLVAYHRISLDAGEEAKLTFTIPPHRLSMVNRDCETVVEPGDFEFWVGSSCIDTEDLADLRVEGDEYRLQPDDARIVVVTRGE